MTQNEYKNIQRIIDYQFEQYATKNRACSKYVMSANELRLKIKSHIHTVYGKEAQDNDY